MARVDGIAHTDAVEGGERPLPTSTASARSVLSAVLCECAAMVLENDVGRHAGLHLLVGRPLALLPGVKPVRRSSAAERVHDSRVGLRRIRSLLSTSERSVDAGWARAWRRELAWFAGVLGVGRDLDVVRRAIVGSMLAHDDPDVLVALLSTLDPALTACRATSDAARRTERHARLVDALASVDEDVPFRHRSDKRAAVVLSRDLEAAWARAQTSAVRARRRETPTRLHAYRVDLKRVQYAAEVLALVVPSARPLARRAGRLQRRLGRHRDALMTSEWLADVLAERPELAPPTHGLVAALADRSLSARRKWWRETKALAVMVGATEG